MALIDVLQDLGAALDKDDISALKGTKESDDPVRYRAEWSDETGAFTIKFNYTDRWVQGKQAGVGAVSDQIELTQQQADALKTKFDEHIEAVNTAKYGSLVSSLETIANA